MPSDPSGFSAVRRFLARHPPAVGGVYVFTLFMTFVYMPYDVLVKPFTQGIASAEEVWLGFMLTGWAAKLTEPLHWAIYAALAFGFTRERPWAWTLASLYTVQVALGSVIWVALYAEYSVLGYLMTPVVVAAFLWIAVRLWLLHPERRRAQRERATQTVSPDA